MSTAYKCDNCDTFYDFQHSIFDALHKVKEQYDWAEYLLSINIEGKTSRTNDDKDFCPECIKMMLKKAIIRIDEIQAKKGAPCST